MKIVKIVALGTVGLLAVNTAANLTIHGLMASGGTLAGLMFIIMPTMVTPAPVTLMRHRN